jgi:LPXTG-motif cell wall-anchored protein
MKNVVLAIAVALVLVALPAAAQYDTSAPATTTTTSATTTTTTPTTDQAPIETRTNATAPMHSNDPGLTANGTVVSWNDEEVVLKSASGLLHLKLLPTTTGSRTFTEGQSLSIDYSRNEQGVMLAKQIREGEVSTTTTTGAAVPGSIGATASNVGEAVEEGVEETVKADVDNDGAIGTRGAPTGSGTDTASTTTTTTESTSVDTTSNLPATGSNGPLVGLLGLLALGGAAALRRL